MSDQGPFDPVLILSRLMRRHATTLNAPHACVLLVNSNSSSLTIEYGVGIMEPYVGRIIQADDGVAGYVMSTNQPQYIPDYLLWARQYQRLIPETRNQFGAVAGTPVYHNGELWAILSFIWDRDVPSNPEAVTAELAAISTSATTLIAQLLTPVVELPIIHTSTISAAAQ